MGLVIARHEAADGCSVAGDPCIVWDDDLPGWRMVLFFSSSGNAQAICTNRDNPGPGQWKLLGPIPFANPEDILGKYAHKPFIVMDARHPNCAARIDGRFQLLVVSVRDGHKMIQRAFAERLGGPWTVEKEPLIGTGSDSDFDANHADAVTGFYFPERGQVLYFYMGYPIKPQARNVSPFGSAQAVAVQDVKENRVRKLGIVLPPSQQIGHWASGWVGGLQLLPGARHRWTAVANASPTAPTPADKAIHREEPPPSLGGFAFCDEEWPVKGWQWLSDPIEWIENVPADAIANGEGVNLWRQHILCLPSGRLALYYNSGTYGKEQLYMKLSQ